MTTNVPLFAYNEITLKTLNVNKTIQVIDKKCLGIIQYGARQLIEEFPNKKWSKHSVEDFLKRLRTTGSTQRAPGSGRPRTTCTAENVVAVRDLVKS